MEDPSLSVGKAEMRTPRLLHVVITDARFVLLDAYVVDNVQTVGK